MNFVSAKLGDRFQRKYAERFFEVEIKEPFQYTNPRITSQRAKDECVLSIESYLRRFALQELGLDPKTPTMAFRESSSYEMALGHVAAYNDYLEAVIHCNVAACTICNLVGQVDNWFGWNRGVNPPTPQSRCRCCQSLGALAESELSETPAASEPRTYAATDLDPVWEKKVKTCPKCNATAFGRKALLRTFGARTLQGKVQPQSYCRTCRAPSSFYST